MHIPVLKEEVMQYLNPKRNENFIDCTIGEGGHTFAILEKTGLSGRVLGIDKDNRNIKLVKDKAKQNNFSNRLIAKEDNYINLKKIVQKEKFSKVSGFLFDLGMSSWHIDSSKRGFSFQKDEILDMRYSIKDELTAWDIVNSWPPEEIESILKSFAEEKFSKKITSAIISRRKIKKIDTAIDLAEIIKNIFPKIKKIHPATKTFQAIRIAVNSELQNIKKALPDAIEILEEGGVISIISFHSLEDRIVKTFLKQSEEITVITKKPVVPSPKEIINNARSRSAKLRVAIKNKTK
ncbi:MAG: 16S rRNA (cytosine(1402)-N(4))-methyltransferase RsmH [Candidatus Pacebacteria bacterium]|nr:16S rRNA (cytosine(1402)-N(4))-methyltransferase RsmH [Candidatus Paceibacterota bacterium]